MSLSIITVDEREKWDTIVKSFKDHDVYYLNGYVKAFQLHGDGEPLLFYFDNGSTRAINVVMKRDIAKDTHFIGKIEDNTYFDLSTPYGYGGFLIEGNDYQSLGKQYTQWCKENSIVSEFVRFHPLINNVVYLKNIYETVFLGNTVSMNIVNTETIQNNLSESNKRQIKKAKKLGLNVYCGRDEWLIDEFINIYNATMEKNNANKYYYFERCFYESILYDLKSNALFFYTKLNNEIIAMAVITFDNNKVHHHLSGSKMQYLHTAPMNLLFYEIACWGSANGYKEFHLGGGRGAQRDSLHKFKKSFNRNEDKEFYIGKAIFNQEIYNNLLNIRKNEKAFDEETDYFPKYRG